jgi:hypothetical protein
MPIEPLTQQQSWARWKGLFPPPQAKLGEKIPKNLRDYFVRDYFVREKFVALKMLLVFLVADLTVYHW